MEQRSQGEVDTDMANAFGALQDGDMRTFNRIWGRLTPVERAHLQTLIDTGVWQRPSMLDEMEAEYRSRLLKWFSLAVAIVVGVVALVLW